MIIAQLSDPHIKLPETGPDSNAAALARAVAHLLELPAPPDVVVITGDCTENGTPAEYARLRELLQPLPMPVYVVPGNHDNRAQLLMAFGTQGSQALPGFVQYAVDDAGPVRLLALDTLVPDAGEGRLSEEQLTWLDTRLREAPDRPTLLLLHHPPFVVGLPAFDNIGLRDAEALGALVARHSQVAALLAGHVHAFMLRRFHGSVALVCPSTMHQLQYDGRHPSPLQAITEPPACLLHTWSAETGLLTRLSIIGPHGPLKTLHDGTRWL